MNIQDFLAAPCGRVLTSTVAFGALAAGALGLAGGTAPAVAMPLVVLVCVVGSIMSVGLAVERFPAIALWLILGLPLAGGLYLAGVTVLAGTRSSAVIALVALGVVAAWSSATGAQSLRRTRDATTRPRPGFMSPMGRTR
jgi:hypothetical protein